MNFLFRLATRPFVALFTAILRLIRRAVLLAKLGAVFAVCVVILDALLAGEPDEPGEEAHT